LPPPEAEDLRILRELHARTEAAHATPVRIKLPVPDRH
jgi:hypothetical protein